MESYKVFLSHSTKDSEFVEKLARALKNEGFEPWLCEVDIIPGDNFVAEIEEGLSRSDLAILIWSPDAARSAWTKIEWTSVLEREISESRIRLGFVLLKDAQRPELLRTKVYIDARADADRGLCDTVAWAKRVRDMRRIVGTKSTYFFLDYEPRDFVGRAEQIETLYAALAEGPGMFLLCGEPGSGKSTLALKFAWQAQGAFDAVLFQSCGQRAAEEIGVELAARLKLDVGTPPPEKQIESAKRWLGERRSLLVLDDIWNNDVKQLMPGPPVSVLCTSRQHHLPWIEPSSAREVESFSREEAETIFRIYLGEENTARYRTALAEFAERVERLPIAVVVAAAILRGEFGPLDEAARGLRLEGLRNEVHDVAGLLRRAIESQPEREQKLLKAMAVCAPAGFWLQLASEIAGLDEAESRVARNQLMSFSLLRLLDRDRQRFQLHALLREQLWKNPEVAELRGKHAAALEGLFRDWESHWRECRECLPEVIPAMQFLWKADEIDRVGWLAYSGSKAGLRTGELEATHRIAKEEESFWARREDAKAKDVLQRNHGIQAVILKAWGRLGAAMELLKKQEDLCLELGNKDGLSKTYGNQALILKAWGRLDEAMTLHKREEALCLELGNKDGLQASYGNQALILNAWGRLDEAMALHKKEEALCLALGDKDGLSACYGNQAEILQCWGRLDEAMELLKRQEALCLALGNRRDLGHCYWSWGLLARAQDDWETEQEKLKRALEIFTELKMPRERDAVEAELKKR
jgi:tetratricopeptide (TPR) repeat protein